MLSPAVSSKARDDLTRGPAQEAYMQPIEQLFQDEEGATAIEYGLIAALIALACIIAFTSLGLNLANIFNTISAALR